MAQTIIYFDRDWMQWYLGSASKIVSANFPRTAIRDLVIIDPAAFENYLQSFLKQYQSVPSPVVIILGDNVLFWTDISKDGDPVEAANEFYNNLPFDNFTKKQYPLPDGRRILGVPQDFTDTIPRILERLSYPVSAIIPVFMLGELSSKRWLDNDLVKYLHKNLENVRIFSLIGAEEIKRKETEKRDFLLAKNKRALVGGAVFVILLVILIVMLIRR